MVRKYFKALVFEWRLKRAKKKAASDAALYGKKFLVVVFGGKPVVVSMQGIKKLIRQHLSQRGSRPRKPKNARCTSPYLTTQKSKRHVPDD